MEFKLTEAKTIRFDKWFICADCGERETLTLEAYNVRATFCYDAINGLHRMLCSSCIPSNKQTVIDNNL